MVITRPSNKNDFDQIFKLNYQTFVEEIPQHEKNEDHVLVDKFHNKNKYIIAKNDKKDVVGMICYSTERPFSLDYKLADLDKYLPSVNQIGEIRLLSVRPDYRNGTVAYRLFQELAHELISQNILTAVISGTTGQLSLYKKIGFIPFGPVVGTIEAPFQPMYITFNQLRASFK